MIELKNVSFFYTGEQADAGVKDISLVFEEGKVVLLCGKSGCGKTTLTRLINGLIPHYYEGTLTGNVVVNGYLVADTALYKMAGIVGSVFQNPRSQFFNVDTDSELAFACENMGMPEEEVRRRMEYAVEELELGSLLGRSIFELSGGEKQKIACGSVSTLEPEVFVLDEPTSNLDMEGIALLKKVVAYWKANGKTVIIAEHRLNFLADLADRVIYLEDGKIAGDYDGVTFFGQQVSFYRDRGLRSPYLKDIWRQERYMPHLKDFCSLQGFYYSYGKPGSVLDIPKAEIPLGHVVAVVGKNGAGKTTLIRSICGLLKHDKGILGIRRKKLKARERLSICYMVMQDVNHQLFTESVLDEVLLSMGQKDQATAEWILDSLDLLEFKDMHPMSLSGGQKQRVAIASALTSDREIIVLDEPTSGLDFLHMQQVAEGIRTLQDKNRTIFIVTHDPEFIAACCTDILLMERGKLREQYPLDSEGMGKLKIFYGI